MSQRAQVTTKRCPMADDGCAARIVEHLGAMYPQPFDAAALVEKQCGRFTRGKNKGRLRGWAEVEVVTVGGWKKDAPGYGAGRVVRPGQILAVRIADFNGKAYLSVVA